MNQFFTAYPGFVSADKLAQSASHRVYWRLQLNSADSSADGPRTLIGVEGTDAAENRSFIEMSRFFGERGEHHSRRISADFASVTMAGR